MTLSSANTAAIQARAKLYQQIRQFFAERNVLEVETPMLLPIADTSSVAMPVQYHLNDELTTGYLHTSPAVAMKQLVTGGIGSICQISKVFRDGVVDRKHAKEFSLLSWYRPAFNLLQSMQEISDLLTIVFGYSVEPKIISYQQAFMHRLDVDPITADIKTLKDVARRVGLYENLGDDRVAWLRLLFTHFVEPTLGMEYPVYLTDFPVEMASNATIKTDEAGNQLAERFELYMDGLKLASVCNEMADSVQCVGVAFGLDKLLMVMLQVRRVDKVITFL
jgi:lysyl-tRNA synthetase class 2